MFEKLLSRLLVERFGRYVDGLDVENVQVCTAPAPAAIAAATPPTGRNCYLSHRRRRHHRRCRRRQVSALRGDVRMEGLMLRTDALDGLELPVRVEWGRIGLFHLNVPWSALGRQPIRVTLEDVHVLASHEDKSEWTEYQVSPLAHADERRPAPLG